MSLKSDGVQVRISGAGLDKHAPRFKWSMAHNEIHHRSGISRFHSPV
jgi:hypothetical protein